MFGATEVSQRAFDILKKHIHFAVEIGIVIFIHSNESKESWTEKKEPAIMRSQTPLGEHDFVRWGYIIVYANIDVDTNM